VTWSIELLPRAEKEMAHAEDWYEARREGLGRRFLDEVEAMFERIAAAPAQFPRWQDMPAISAPCCLASHMW
jgi:hypothetical protein